MTTTLEISEDTAATEAAIASVRQRLLCNQPQPGARLHFHGDKLARVCNIGRQRNGNRILPEFCGSSTGTLLEIRPTLDGQSFSFVIRVDRAAAAVTAAWQRDLKLRRVRSSLIGPLQPAAELRRRQPGVLALLPEHFAVCCVVS